MRTNPTPKVGGAKVPPVSPTITKEKRVIDGLRAKRIGVLIPPRKEYTATVEPSQAFLPTLHVFNRPRMLSTIQKMRYAAREGIRRWMTPKRHQASKGIPPQEKTLNGRLAKTLKRVWKQAA